MRVEGHAGETAVDLLVVGGGINGVGIARDAAGRGLTVMLVEQSDLASATSSASTKLIHGGLRYLEYYEFRLVREALVEREVLLRNAPHIIWPLTFVLPHNSSLRPAWMIRLGLFLYDHLGGRARLPGSRGVDLRHSPFGQPLKPSFVKGFSYADCWVDDARLVALNALDAAERGAEILTRTRCMSARRVANLWEATLRPSPTGVTRQVRARCLVNATGPWVASFIEGGLGFKQRNRLRLIKGSHIVVPRLFDGEQAYILQNADRRIVFAIPYERHFTLIGTTDIPYDGDPASVAISPAEIDYLCDVINQHFARSIRPADVVWSYAGVRPLHDDESDSASAVTRDYVLELEDGDGRPPLLSVFGGKITTYRKLAEHALRKLQRHFPAMRPSWTHAAPLPGGDIPDADFGRFLAEVRARRPWLPESLARRYARAYGTRTDRLVGDAASLAGLGQHLGEDLYAREVEYLVDQEWTRTADDVLWRRSKLGLHISPATQAALKAWFGESPAPAMVVQQ
ncbi:MAG: glycerol-3-phosphate dehydrogenase [Rhodospirillaceae bacterium]|nr:glycerol-3-phosphate dehydrogenase [Rhodospirillaceae bacterium]